MFLKRFFKRPDWPVSVILVVIFVLAAILRFWRIDEYQTFLGDEGRDVLVVKRMLLDGKFTLLGPITSVGSIYMGPVYYYLMAPFLYLWRFDPVGPAVMVALLSLCTILIIYKIGKDYFHSAVGLIAAFTYSIARLSVVYGRASWNPNVVPFFAVLLMFSVIKSLVDHKNSFLILAGLSLGILIQLHYITFLFFPVLIAVFLYFKPNIPFRIYLYSLLAFLFSYSPFILFELRHEFVNTLGAWNFIVAHNTGSTGLLIDSWWQTIRDVTIRIFWRLIVTGSAELTKYLIAGAGIIYFVSRSFFNSQTKTYNAFKILLIWLAVGILSFGLYRGAIYDYYFGSLFPLPHLFFALFLFLLWKRNLPGKLTAVLLLGLITVFNIIQSPLVIEPNNMVKNTREIAGFVLEKTGGTPYNFALLTDKNSDHAYRYFLELWGSPPVVIENPQADPERRSVTDQLLIVCEEKVCQPLGHPLWEIAGFGRAQIYGQWPVSTVKVYRLTHYEKN